MASSNSERLHPPLHHTGSDGIAIFGFDHIVAEGVLL